MPRSKVRCSTTSSPLSMRATSSAASSLSATPPSCHLWARPKARPCRPTCCAVMDSMSCRPHCGKSFVSRKRRASCGMPPCCAVSSTPNRCSTSRRFAFSASRTCETSRATNLSTRFRTATPATDSTRRWSSAVPTSVPSSITTASGHRFSDVRRNFRARTS